MNRPLVISLAVGAMMLAQKGTIMSWGKASAFLAALILWGSVFSSAAQAQRAEDAALLQYRVKFICGPADGNILALGTYFTAINVHNPIEDEFAKPISLRVKFAVALPGLSPGGHTEFTGFFDLTSDDALELDCPEIVQRTGRLCPAEPAGFCKGFVVIESRAELDVIPVYTVADLNTKQVTTLHTDRVLPHCPIHTEVLPQQTVLFVPPNVGGAGGADPDFKGNGPCVDFRLALQLEDEDKTLAAKYRMHAYGCDGSFEKPQNDFTSAQGDDDLVLKVASPRGRILGYDVDTSMSQQFIDSDHADNIFSYGPPNPVERLRFVGDTEGDEAGTRTGVFITFRETRVELETCAPPAELTVRVTVLPFGSGLPGDPGDPGRFNLHVDNTTIATNKRNGEQTGPHTLAPGAHTLSVAAGGGTDLANYRTTICGACSAEGAIQPGVRQSCSITNLRLTNPNPAPGCPTACLSALLQCGAGGDPPEFCNDVFHRCLNRCQISSARRFSIARYTRPGMPSVNLTERDADEILAEMSNVLRHFDGSDDIECNVAFCRDGTIEEYAIDDGIIDNEAELLAVAALPQDIKVVRAINFCGLFIAALGCRVGDTFVVRRLILLCQTEILASDHVGKYNVMC